MLIKDIVNRVNKLLSNNSSFRLNYDTLKLYIDGSIDNINRELKTDYANPDTVYYSNLKYNFAISSHYITLMIETYDIEYTYELKNDKVFVRNRDGDKYDGLATAVYIEEYDKLFIKSSTSVQADLFDLEVTDEVIYNHPHVIEGMNYTEIPDRYIRSCMVYYTAALYLEEEDELEGQYQTYKNKADEELKEWRRQYYSCYDTKW